MSPNFWDGWSFVGCRGSTFGGIPEIWTGNWYCLSGIFDEMISGVADWSVWSVVGILGVDSSMFPIYEELIEESKKVWADNGIELWGVEDWGVCGDVERKIKENISEEFDCGLSDRVEFHGAGDWFGFIIEAGLCGWADWGEEVGRDESGCGACVNKDGTVPLTNFGLNDWASECGVEGLSENRVGSCRVEEHSNIATVTVVVEIASGRCRSILRWCSRSWVIGRRGVGHSLMSVAIDRGWTRGVTLRGVWWGLIIVLTIRTLMWQFSRVVVLRIRRSRTRVTIVSNVGFSWDGAIAIVAISWDASVGVISSVIIISTVIGWSAVSKVGWAILRARFMGWLDRFLDEASDVR